MRMGVKDLGSEMSYIEVILSCDSVVKKCSHFGQTTNFCLVVEVLVQCAERMGDFRTAYCSFFRFSFRVIDFDI